MKTLTSRLLLIAFLCGLTVFTVAQVRKISQEPVTTTITDRDDLILNKAVGANYTTRRIAWSNVMSGTIWVQPGGETLSNAIARATPGQTVRVLPGNYVHTKTNVYRLNQSTNDCNIQIAFKTNLVIEGSSLPHVSLASNVGTLFLIYRSSNVVIRGLKISSAIPAGAARDLPANLQVYGQVSVVNSSEVWIEDCEFAGGQDWAILSDAQGAESGSTNVCVRGCRFFDYGSWQPSQARFEGACIASDAGWIIENNYAEAVVGFAEPFPSPPALGLYTVIRNNTVRNFLQPAIGTGDSYIRDIVVTGNDLWLDPGWTRNGTNPLTAFGIQFNNATNLIVANNRIHGAMAGIYLYCGESIVIRKNEIHAQRAHAVTGNTLGPAISLVGATAGGPGIRNVTVADNSIWESGQDAIRFGAATNLFIRNNSFWNNCTNLGSRAIWARDDGVLGYNNNVVIEDNAFWDSQSSPLQTTAIEFDAAKTTNSIVGRNYYGVGISSRVLNNAGQGVSWLSEPGFARVDTVSYTNCCASGTTNMAQLRIPGNTLTNNGDALLFWAAGQMKNATATTNQLSVVFGATTLLASGSQTASNTAWSLEGRITRTGNTAQVGAAVLFWDGASPWKQTNVNLVLAETNGIGTILKLMSGSTATAVVTQNFFRVQYVPATQ